MRWKYSIAFSRSVRLCHHCTPTNFNKGLMTSAGISSFFTGLFLILCNWGYWHLKQQTLWLMKVPDRIPDELFVAFEKVLQAHTHILQAHHDISGCTVAALRACGTVFVVGGRRCSARCRCCSVAAGVWSCYAGSPRSIVQCAQYHLVLPSRGHECHGYLFELTSWKVYAVKLWLKCVQYSKNYNLIHI